ncbi:MAG: hypothetical protein LBI43_06770 [Streptococcaceae bacterium]|jgi:hypothetical protein|nr:hypothetical protein [Streptococcaceae bacterium]
MRDEGKVKLFKYLGVIVAVILVLVVIVTTILTPKPKQVSSSKNSSAVSSSKLISSNTTSSADNSIDTISSSDSTSSALPVDGTTVASGKQSEQEKFVNLFLKTYCDYSSYDTMNKAIKPMLTKAEQKSLGVDTKVGGSLTSSVSQITVWENGSSTYCGVVTASLNNGANLTKAYYVTLIKSGNSFLVSKIVSPNDNT